MTAPDPTAGEHHSNCYQNTGVPDDMPSGICDCRVLQMLDAASPPAVAASTGTSEDVEALVAWLVEQGGSPGSSLHSWRCEYPDRYGECDCLTESARDLLASDWLAAREAAARAAERERIAQAQRCGGCKGQGSHRRHCPRHPNYHPWIPLADRAESIGDSIGEPGLANQAWALAGAIREQMPNHPYRPVRHREAR